MKKEETATAIELEPQPVMTGKGGDKDGITIGMLGNGGETDETRILLTPEACGILVSSGHRVGMETGAGIDISFTDADYADYGVKILPREEVLKASTVISFLPPSANDIKKMNPHSALLCYMGKEVLDRNFIKALLDREITMGCLDNMYSCSELPIFADIIDEIDGRAAVVYAQEHLSFLGGGKGVLLGNIAGLNPCEVLIFGEGHDVISAARAAKSVGANVTIANNDISILHRIQEKVGPEISTVAIHPRVIFNKIKTADVIFLGTTTRPFELPANLKGAIKETAYVLDFKESHPSVSVPRTVAMAISNVLVYFFNEMLMQQGFDNMIKINEGVQSGIVTFRGQLTDKLVASYLGMSSVSLGVMLAGRN